MNAGRSFTAPLGVSARHVHLTAEHVGVLFGSGLHAERNLGQPGEFAAVERVTLATTRGSITGVRVLGPPRTKTQAEISITDTVTLGIPAVVRLSGNIEGTPGLTLIGPKGSVYIKEGAIIAARHLHITPMEANRHNLKSQQLVQAAADTDRSVLFNDVIVRVSPTAALEMHLDTDEANAAHLKSGDQIRIIVREPAPGIAPADRMICLEDVQSMIKEGRTIHQSRGLRITPAALDLARARGILVD